MFPHPIATAVALGLLVLLAGPAGASEGEPTPEPDSERSTEVIVDGKKRETPPPDESVADDSTHLEALAFPELRYRDGLRVNFQSQFLPDADLGPGHTSLYQPDLRVRMNLPVSRRAIVRLSAKVGMSSYQFRGGPIFQNSGVDLIGKSLDLYRTRVTAQGALRLNEAGESWITDNETWALLATVGADSSWESGAFDDSLRVGSGLALGYEIDDTLRLALGAIVGVSPDSGDVEVGPLATFRWSVTDRLTVRDRSLGLQLEYSWSPQLELFVSGFRNSDSYRLRRSSTFGDDISLRDRQWLVGGGFEWKLSRYLRLNAEGGVVVQRKLKVSEGDLGTLASESADPGAYIDLRIELRP
jgi:hypothetical protein